MKYVTDGYSWDFRTKGRLKIGILGILKQGVKCHPLTLTLIYFMFLVNIVCVSNIIYKPSIAMEKKYFSVFSHRKVQGQYSSII